MLKEVVEDKQIRLGDLTLPPASGFKFDVDQVLTERDWRLMGELLKETFFITRIEEISQDVETEIRNRTTYASLAKILQPAKYDYYLRPNILDMDLRFLEAEASVLIDGYHYNDLKYWWNIMHSFNTLLLLSPGTISNRQIERAWHAADDSLKDWGLGSPGCLQYLFEAKLAFPDRLETAQLEQRYPSFRGKLIGLVNDYSQKTNNDDERSTHLRNSVELLSDYWLLLPEEASKKAGIWYPNRQQRDKLASVASMICQNGEWDEALDIIFSMYVLEGRKFDFSAGRLTLLPPITPTTERQSLPEKRKY